MRVKFMLRIVSAIILGLASSILVPLQAGAAEGDFSLQITPSPLVSTLKPGIATDLELKIRNGSTNNEQLKIEPRSFRFDSKTGEALIDDATPPEIAPWISFSAPTFSLKPGEWFTQKIRVALPPSAGFSYSFILLISRKDNPASTNSGHLLKGSVAVFTLLNVDRPGATRSLEVVSVEPTQGLYEYLPVTLNIRLKNTGNTIAQPYGNIFIQRGSNDPQAISTLSVNDAKSYLLPGTERTLQATWTDGFPLYQTSLDASGKPKTTLAWNFDRLSHFRFGRYAAKVITVYNDGQRDIPITKEVSFWVIPWKAILLILGILVAFILLMRRYIKFRTERAVRRALNAQKKTS